MIELDYPAVGRRIGLYRRVNDLTAAELAQKVGPPLTREILAKIESGKRNTLDVGLLISIAWELGVSPLALLFDAEGLGEVETSTGPIDVADVFDWAAGWYTRGPGRVENITPAGLQSARRILGINTLRRRQQAVKTIEERMESLAKHGPQSQFEVEYERLEVAKRDLAETREALGLNHDG